MVSPFPGMDPYIEDPEIWSDFHGDLAAEIRAQLNTTIQPRYVARMTPSVTYELIEVAKSRTIRPDVAIWQPQPPKSSGGAGVAVAPLRPPLEQPVPAAPYYVTLSRAPDRPVVEVWPIRLAEPLPLIPVPLLEPDPDAVLDLSAVVTSVYERGGYARLIDYKQTPPPPALSVQEKTWLNSHLQAAAIRP